MPITGKIGETSAGPVDKIPLRVIHGVFEKHHLQKIHNFTESSITTLEPVLSDIYFVVSKENLFDTEKDFICSLLINLLLNIYDSEKKSMISIVSCKIFLTLLCQANPKEKYIYMFHQLSDMYNCLSRKNLEVLLKILIDVIEFIGEKNAFGSYLIPGTVQSCFKNKSAKVGISESQFTSWLMHDPQLLAWFSVFYRMQISEIVSHKVKCKICNTYPIIGLRYRCLRCLSSNMCQICFLTGKLIKRHSLTHPIQEYCHIVSTWQSSKAFLLTLKNRLWRKNSTFQYLPSHKINKLGFENCIQNENASTFHPSGNAFPFNEIQSIIFNLAVENKKLIPQLTKMCEDLENAKFIRNRVELKNCLLEHKLQVENMIRCLTALENVNTPSTNIRSIPPVASTPVVNLFVSESKRKKFNRELENLSPIKMCDLPRSNMDENKSLEKKLLGQNHDIGNAVRYSWEESRTNSNELDMVVFDTQKKDYSQFGRSFIKSEFQVKDKSLQMHHKDESDILHEGFNWLLKNENSGYMLPDKNKFFGKEFKKLQQDLKETVDKLQGLSEDLILRSDVYEKDKIFVDIENVDSLLTNLIEGVSKLVEI